MRRERSSSDGNNFWQSYADMMAAILLVTILVLSGAVYQAQKNIEDKEKKMDEQQTQMDEQQGQLEEDEQALADLKDKYTEAQGKLEEILGIRREIIEKLMQEFQNEAKLSINDQTGAIMFDSELLFDTDKYVIKPEGEQFLNQFIPVYMSVLTSEEFEEYVGEIIIEGHADTDGSYLYNLELSQDRALSVASFFLADDAKMFPSEMKDRLRKIVTANGRSWSNPIMNPDDTVNMDASRRVEIQFRLKDEEMVNEMIDIIQ